jgi:hypothetical protein
LNERFEQYINGKRENLHANFTLRLKKILWEARSTPTLGDDQKKKKIPRILHRKGTHDISTFFGLRDHILIV